MPPLELFADDAATTLTSSPSSSATSFTVTSSAGFPVAVTGASFFRVLIGTEQVIVTNVSGTTWTCDALTSGHTSGDPVTLVVFASGLEGLQAVVPPTNFLAPTSAAFETFPRNAQLNSTATISSGVLYFYAIALPAGLSVGHICFSSNSTAAGTPTHWWFGLYDQNRVQLATTSDQTTTAWASSTSKNLAVAATSVGAASEFVTTYTGLHYVALMMTATTTVNLAAMTALAVATGQSPILFGATNTGQTAPPTFPFTAAAISTTTNPAYAWVGA